MQRCKTVAEILARQNHGGSSTGMATTSMTTQATATKPPLLSRRQKAAQAEAEMTQKVANALADCEPRTIRDVYPSDSMLWASDGELDVSEDEESDSDLTIIDNQTTPPLPTPVAKRARTTVAPSGATTMTTLLVGATTPVQKEVALLNARALSVLELHIETTVTNMLSVMNLLEASPQVATEHIKSRLGQLRRWMDYHLQTPIYKE